LNTSKKTL
jgi:integrase/recombinase XerD